MIYVKERRSRDHAAWGLAALALIGIAGEAHADMNCAFSQGHGALTATRPLQAATLTVGNDVPLGTIVSLQRFPALPNAKMRCTGGVSASVQEQYLLSTVPRLAEWQPSDNSAGHVFASGVPGIGYSVRYYSGASANVPTNYSQFRYLNNTTGFAPDVFSRSVPENPIDINGLASEVEVAFIKTGNIAPGEVSGASLPTLRWTFGNLLLYSLSFIGNVHVVPQTCTTPRQIVALNTSLETQFTGHGSGGPPVHFAVQLRNCPSFATTQERTSAPVRYQLAPTASNVEAPGVLKLSPAHPAAAAAGGIGIEIRPVDSPSSSTLFFNAWQSGLSRQAGDPYDSWSIPLAARYVQTTAGGVSPGAADGAVELVIDYR